MLIKLTVPFILAATVFSASVPIQDRVGAASEIACPPAQAPNPGQANGLPTNTDGVLAVRDFLGTIVGYLAPPQNDQQGFSFTEDRANALLANIIGTDDGQGASGNGKQLNVRIGLAGSDNFLGGAVVSLPTSSDGEPSKGGASSGGSPSSNGSPSSGGSPSNGSGGAPCASCDPLAGLGGLLPLGGKPTTAPSSAGDSLPLADTKPLTVALGLVSAEELSSEEKSMKLKDSVGDAFNLSFLYDTESRQILGQKQVGNSSPQPTNFQYDQGHFCLFDQKRAQASASQSAAGFVNVFFVPA